MVDRYELVVRVLGDRVEGDLPVSLAQMSPTNTYLWLEPVLELVATRSKEPCPGHTGLLLLVPTHSNSPDTSASIQQIPGQRGTYLALGKAFCQSEMYIPCSPSGATIHLTCPASDPVPASEDSFSIADLVDGETGEEA
jgi:hypothetical protein